MNGRTDIEVVLACRAFGYRLLQSLFGAEPTSDQLISASDEAGMQALEYIASYGDEACIESFSRVKDEIVSYRSASPGEIDGLRAAYTRLFLGPEKLPAPPWESVYVTKDRLVFQESTLAVRRFYASHGFQAKAHRRVPDDHIALEFDFMACLGDRATKLYREGACAEAVEALIASRTFVREHLGKWISAWSDDLQACQDEAFYSLLGAYARDYVATDEQVLSDLIELMQGEKEASEHDNQ